MPHLMLDIHPVESCQSFPSILLDTQHPNPVLTVSFFFCNKKPTVSLQNCSGHFIAGPVCLPTYIRRMMKSFETEKPNQVRIKLFK